MQECVIKVIYLAEAQGLPLPEYATPNSAGMDIYAANLEPIIMKPNQRVLVPTGLKLELPEGFEMQIRPRSGLAYKNGITVLNSPGTIDSDYRGEVSVLLVNLGENNFIVERGMRIAQAVVAKHERVVFKLQSTLSHTERGEGGFGHSGIK